jgi:hypothetical protein
MSSAGADDAALRPRHREEPKGGAAIQSRSPMTPPNEVTVGLKPRYAQNVGS